MTKMMSMGARPVSAPRMPSKDAWKARRVQGAGEEVKNSFMGGCDPDSSQVSRQEILPSAFMGSQVRGDRQPPDGPAKQAPPADLRQWYGRRGSPFQSTYRVR